MSSTPPHGSAADVSSNWVCPFCALLCDDVTIRAYADGTLDAPDARCPKLAHALAGYSGTDAQCSASIDGAPASADDALDRAAQRLARAHRPLFGGLATDVAGARALYPLAAACGAALDHLHGETLAPAILAQQDRGALFTTLSEIRTRADLVVVFACRPAERQPRFYERALGQPGDGGFARRIVFVGCDADPAATAYASRSADVTVETLLADANPYDTLARWSARVESRSGAARRTGDDTATLAALVERIAGARYTAFVYEPAALPGDHTALLIEALSRIVKAANRTTRGGALALGGGDGAATVNQTLTWLSGMPLRTRVAKPARLAGEPPLDHDPYRYRTAQLLERGETDLLLWIASFGAEPLPAALAPAVPAIVLGHPALAAPLAARGASTVFIPVATPGIDAGGHLFRVDGPVVLPLAAARGLPLPGVNDVVAKLAERVAALAGGSNASASNGIAAIPLAVASGAAPHAGASA
ncbi:formylmethanofuran dehydrogenase [Paraburkholderia caballeronis]|uniref:formylmethanofuran dehydrogenase n=1 Tax=Paraburkholderia caballeronis TaxID=416943 RepID=UPI001065B191|nr:formylmethanofuran dehydrogenase [Paraburkholderia caballeronis]TDV19525.1 formylmethanofuran dehydrogenase subunit B [Paraburkholderia caballeronis]TDV22125.1 formylmethanofuran dehydrogenase subunit B [Paraburkholderia caballeronis]TDV29029.1 formylmethanofuran dehydrogenase subunit B [Paraburkholderia caballeronis]